MPASTTRNSFLLYVAERRTTNVLLTFSGLPAKTVTGHGPVCRTNKLCLARGCREISWFTSGLCQEGIKALHKRHTDRKLRRKGYVHRVFDSKGQQTLIFLNKKSCGIGKDKDSCLLKKDQKDRKTTGTYQFKCPCA